MYKSIFLKLFVVLACIALLASCEIFKGPDFPDTPSISFDRIDLYRGITSAGSTADSIVIVIRFRDGDGDLGITPEERNSDPRFMREKPDGTKNRYHYNYILKVFQKVNGVFKERRFTGFDEYAYSGGFLPLRTDGKPGPIEGNLEYQVTPFFHSFTPPNDTLKFEVQIIDRALHESNIVETEEVVLNIK